MLILCSHQRPDSYDRIPLKSNGNIKPLSGRKGEYRMRVGKYRILFYIKDEDMYVVKIDTRGDVYKK